MNIPQLPADKANHVVYGAVAFLIGAFVGQQAGLVPGYCGLGLAAAVGALKEAADAIVNYRTTGDPLAGPHGVELLDFAATACGGALSFAASWLA